MTSMHLYIAILLAAEYFIQITVKCCPSLHFIVGICQRRTKVNKDNFIGWRKNLGIGHCDSKCQIFPMVVWVTTFKLWWDL